VASGSGGSGAGSTGFAVAKGGNLCSLLGPGDFAAVGVAGARNPTDSPDEAGGHYCVYAGVSGATGGIEFDAFTGDPIATYQTIVGETGALTAVTSADLPGVDQAGVKLSGTWSAIVVRKGSLSFAISFPSSANARTQLVSLAQLVLARATGVV
jgi:hypothetical protein